MTAVTATRTTSKSTGRGQPAHPPPARERTTGAEVTIILGCVAVAILGFATSFEKVAANMRRDFGDMAPMVPLGVDLGILVASAAHIVLARRGEGHPALRVVPHALTAATIYLNVVSGHTLEGRIAHGVMVGLWAVAVEVAAHTAKVRIGIDTGQRFDPIPVRRWLLDPVRTALLWRRMTLWNITEYQRALAYERARRYAIGLCKARHGRFSWRWDINSLLRMELATGDLPDQVTTAIDRLIDRGQNAGWKTAVHTWIASADHPQALDTATGPPVTADAGTGTEPATKRAAVPVSRPVSRRPAKPAQSDPITGAHTSNTGTPAASSTSGTGSDTGADTEPDTGTGRPPARTDDELLPLVRKFDEEHRRTKGRPISGDTLAPQIRVSKNRALQLLRLLRTQDAEEQAKAS